MPLIENCPVTWSSRKQRIVAQSTIEAEYIALTHCVRDVLFVRQMLKELGYAQKTTIIKEDNQACIAIAENPTQHARTKHIDVRYHFVREHVSENRIKLEYVMSRENLADIFTKGLGRELYVDLKSRMDVESVSRGRGY